LKKVSQTKDANSWQGFILRLHDLAFLHFRRFGQVGYLVTVQTWQRTKSWRASCHFAIFPSLVNFDFCFILSLKLPWAHLPLKLPWAHLLPFALEAHWLPGCILSLNHWLLCSILSLAALSLLCSLAAFPSFAPLRFIGCIPPLASPCLASPCL
jgi:hypothetical protein